MKVFPAWLGLAAFAFQAAPPVPICPADQYEFLRFIIILLLGVLIPGPDAWRRRVADVVGGKTSSDGK